MRKIILIINSIFIILFCYNNVFGQKNFDSTKYYKFIQSLNINIGYPYYFFDYSEKPPNGSAYLGHFPPNTYFDYLTYKKVRNKFNFCSDITFNKYFKSQKIEFGIGYNRVCSEINYDEIVVKKIINYIYFPLLFNQTLSFVKNNSLVKSRLSFEIGAVLFQSVNYFVNSQSNLNDNSYIMLHYKDSLVVSEKGNKGLKPSFDFSIGLKYIILSKPNQNLYISLFSGYYFKKDEIVKTSVRQADVAFEKYQIGLKIGLELYLKKRSIK